MKKLFAVLLAAVMLFPGCSDKTGNGADSTDGIGGANGTGDPVGALGTTGGTEDGSVSPVSAASSDKLTSAERASYQFLLPGDTPVEITDETVINELWMFLEECENGEECRFSHGTAPAGVKGDPALILTDKATGAEYEIAPGFPFHCNNAKDDEPVIRISGKSGDELLWAAYKDEFGKFGALLNGLADRLAFDDTLLTDGEFNDYEFTAELTYYDREPLCGMLTVSAAKQIWELVGELERVGEFDTGNVAGYGVGNCTVTARNTVTGETVVISDGTVGIKPAELAVDEYVVYVGRKTYPSVYLPDDGIYAHVKLERIVEDCLTGSDSGSNGGNADPEQSSVEKMTDGDIKEFEIYGDTEGGYGEITGEVKRLVWDKLAEIERAEPIKSGGSNVGGCCRDRIVCTYVPTRKTYYVTDGIYYASPELDGGPGAVRINDVYRMGNLHGVFDAIRAELEARELSPAKLTVNSFEDFEFSGSAGTYDGATLTTTKYSGSIPEKTARKLWEFLVQIESSGHFDYDDNDYADNFGDTFTIRNKYTGREYKFSRGILYENPYVDGGAEVYVLQGIQFGKRKYSCYGKNIEGDDYFTFADKFDELVAEGIVRKENIVETFTADPVPSKSDIVLVRNYTNWAWGYVNNGVFIDLSGNAYEFDISDIPSEVIGSGEDLIALLERKHYAHEFGDPVGTFEDTDLLWNIHDLADRVSPNAKITEKHAACDAGQRTLYAVNSEHIPVIISSTGDFDRVNTDLNALNIALKCALNKIP